MERGGAAAAASLVAGLRILEVNDISLLGCSQEQAARIISKAGTVVKLLVCDAFSSSYSVSFIFF